MVWSKIFERFRRIVLSAPMMAVRCRIAREGEVVYSVAHQLTDLSGELASVGERDTAFPLLDGRGDEFHHGSATRHPRDAGRRRSARGASTCGTCISTRSR